MCGRHKVCLLGIGLMLVLLGACASGISPQIRSQVSYYGDFMELQQHSERYLGETALLGGKIIETRASTTSSEITVLQLPLDGQDRPQDTDRSEGRFLLRSQQFLDPLIYKAGILLTVVGRISGKEARPIGDFDYFYPQLDALEIKLWPVSRGLGPQFHFGVGVGTHF